jgi:hypothetical protein
MPRTDSAEAVLAGRAEGDVKAALEQVQRSALYAEDSGLMVPEPRAPPTRTSPSCLPR